MKEYDADLLLNNIQHNCDVNMHRNADFIQSPQEAVYVAQAYLDNCKTLISRDVNRCPDKMDLLLSLGYDICELSYLLVVMHSYLEETALQIELDTPSREYTFNKTNRKNSNETNTN